MGKGTKSNRNTREGRVEVSSVHLIMNLASSVTATLNIAGVFFIFWRSETARTGKEEKGRQRERQGAGSKDRCETPTVQCPPSTTWSSLVSLMPALCSQLSRYPNTCANHIAPSRPPNAFPRSFLRGARDRMPIGESSLKPVANMAPAPP